MKNEMHIVSHTHWDREWYVSFQEYRIRLVKAVDILLELLDKEPEFKYYMLDGQTIVLDDYLEIRPENENKLKKYIKNGRILVGPWYVLADESLSSGECLIRNLLLGHRIARKFGKVMKVGYSPDPFGHTAQIPQIMAGFGITESVVGRGVGGTPDQIKSELWWESPDGTRSFTAWLPNMYCNLMIVRYDDEDVTKQLKEVRDALIPWSTTPYLLLMHGVDHFYPDGKIVNRIKEWNSLLADEVKVLHSNLPMYLKKLKQSANLKRIPVIKGELRSCQKEFLLYGTLSTRIYLKQANEEVAGELEKWAEPFSTFSWLLGDDSHQSQIWQAWKYLLQNMPHDSICGCSIDAVHRQMLTRFEWANEIAQMISRRALEYLASKINTKFLQQDELAVVVFNPTGWDIKNKPVELEFDLPAEEKWNNFTIKNKDGKEIAYQQIGKSKYTKVGVYDIDMPIWTTFVAKKKYSCVLESITVPACGYTTLKISPKQSKNLTGGNISHSYNLLENEFLKVNINSNGTLDILDKRNERMYQGCNLFEDSADVGDEYNYSSCENEQIISHSNTAAEIKLVHNGPVFAQYEIKIELSIPRGITPDRKFRTEEKTKFLITSLVSLTRGIPQVDIETIVDNNAENHRLRVLFPSNIDTEYSYADAQFTVVQRNIKLLNPELYKIEEPPSTHPQWSFVDVNDTKNGLAIGNKGLPEFEIKNDELRTITLTLFRAVDQLSRNDFPSRKYRDAGPQVPTPEAQCLRKMEFNYTIIPHQNSWDASLVYKLVQQKNYPCRTVTVGINPGYLELEKGLVKIEPEELVLSTIKQSEKGDSVIIRFFNPTDRLIKTIINVGLKCKKVYLVGLNEKRAKLLALNKKNLVKLNIGKHKIISLELVGVYGKN